MSSRLRSYVLHRYLRIVLSVCFSLLVITFLGLIFLYAFRLNRIEVDGQGMAIEFDRKKLGENLLLIQTDQLKRELLNNYPLLSDVRFEKQFFGTLVIHLVKRDPSAALVSQNNIFFLDQNGYVLGQSGDSSLYPTIRIDSEAMPIGARVSDPRIRSCLLFFVSLAELTHEYSCRRAGDTRVTVEYKNTSILLDSGSDMREKASTLQTLIEGFRIKGALPAVIDLRFDKPIVTQ